MPLLLYYSSMLTANGTNLRFLGTVTLPFKIFQLHKVAKRPQCNSDFINKIGVRSNTEFSQPQLVKLKVEPTFDQIR